MRLDLREIINIPGGQVPFDYEPDLSELSFDSVKEIKKPVHVSGRVQNIAGVLVLTADICADLICICARCLKEFGHSMHICVEVTLAEEIHDESDVDVFLLEGDNVDVDEIVTTYVVLNMEQRFLCREDCKGLCPKCGADLNEGPCTCKAEIDPRLTVLGQLLENE
jgi:uncharacterized protein